MKDRHVMECLGMSRVVIEDGKVTEVGEPKIRFCPLFKKYRNIDEITEDVVRSNIEFRIGSFGMCTPDRDIRMRDFLSFGISEILSSALKHGRIDAAVIAADGCGTVVVTDPEIVQGLGGRISGICETSPIDSVIDGVGRANVLDPSSAEIDMVKGLRKAKGMGFGRIAVTVVSMKDASVIREESGGSAVLRAVHTTCMSPEDSVIAFDICDVITACASKAVRDESKKRDVIVAGNKVPVYGVSDKGKELVMMRLEEVGKEPWDGKEPEEPPFPLI
jgi:putative methanogenesis marker protein 8